MTESTAFEKAFDKEMEALEDLRVALNRRWYVSLDDNAPELYDQQVHDGAMEAFEAAIDAYFAVCDAIEAEDRAKGRPRKSPAASPFRNLSLVGQLPRKQGDKGKGAERPKGRFAPPDDGPEGP